jgi:hypothetical protein
MIYHGISDVLISGMPFIVSGHYMQAIDENKRYDRIVMSVKRLRNTMKANLLFFLWIIPGMFLQASIPDTAIILNFERQALTLYRNNPDSTKKLANDSVQAEMRSLLKKPSSINFPFDSLKFVKTVTPSDKSFLLITWTVPYADGHGYYGFLQINGNREIMELTELVDNGGKSNPDTSYPAADWPGAVYYGLIEERTKTGRLFTLFGWRGGEPGIARRVIEVLTFDEAGDPVFGAPVFQMDHNVMQYRVNFEFTDQVPFHLGYEEQLIPGKRSKKGWMIIFNRLTGNDPARGRFYRAAVPSYNTFDALIFKNGHWQLHKDIDARATETGSPARNSRR